MRLGVVSRVDENGRGREGDFEEYSIGDGVVRLFGARAISLDI